MSCDYHITCITCDPAGRDGPGRGADLNHMGDELLALLPKLPAIARFWSETGLNPRIDIYPAWALESLGEWAADHVGHEFAVFDEYGGRWPDVVQP